MFRKAKLLSREEMRSVKGGEIRKFRDEKCYTQSYVASQLGIGQSAYQKMESGEVKISIDKLHRLAEILEKPIAVLLGEQADNPLNQDDIFIRVSKAEYELMQKIILQQEKRLQELEEKISYMNKNN